MCQDRLPRCCPPTASSASPRGSRPTSPRSCCPAWDEFLAIAAELDLDGPTRLDGWQARHVCVHLGSWPGSRSLHRMREEAEQDDLAAADWADHRAATFDQDAHNEAVLEARARRAAGRRAGRAAGVPRRGRGVLRQRRGRRARAAGGCARCSARCRWAPWSRPAPTSWRCTPWTWRRPAPGRRRRPCCRPGWPPWSTPPAGWPPAATSRPAPAASRRRAAGRSPRCRVPGPRSSCPPCRRPGRPSRAARPTCSTPRPDGGRCRRCWPAATCGCTT